MNAIQLRDASDITEFRKKRAIQQNYVQLRSKNQLPIGGISHEHLMALARTNAMYIPANSLVAVVNAQAACPSCKDSVIYTAGQVVSYGCSTTCSGGSSYTPETFVNNFR